MEQSKIRSKLPFIIAGGVVALLLVIYLGFALFFNSHYYFKTTVNGQSVGGKKAEYLVDKNTKAAESYLLTLHDRMGNSFSLLGSDIDYAYQNSGEEEAILKSQNGFGWISCLFKSHEYTTAASILYDEDKLETAIQALEIFEDSYIEQPENAYLYLNGTDYGVVEDTAGNVPIYETIYEEITAALQTEALTCTLSDACYETAEITADSSVITDNLAKLDTYSAASITYDVEDNGMTLDHDGILALVALDESGNVSIDDSKLTSYVQTVASKYNTYGREREFTTALGDVVTIGGGDYGWIVDKTNEKATLLAEIEAGETITREPVYAQRALYRGSNDIGDTYIEIDYTNQHLYYFIDGECVQDYDVVTGNMSNNSGSPDGIYFVKYKTTDTYLNQRSHVDYFIVFAYNAGIHDAYWKSSFGGTQYLPNGSGGCINSPLAEVEKLYDIVTVSTYDADGKLETPGTPVVAYYRTEVELDSDSNRMSNAYSAVEAKEEETTEDAAATTEATTTEAATEDTTVTTQP